MKRWNRLVAGAAMLSLAAGGLADEPPVHFLVKQIELPDDLGIEVFHLTAADMNNVGQAVGWFMQAPDVKNPEFVTYAWIWDESSGMRVICPDAELSQTVEAHRINDLGYVAGIIRDPCPGGECWGSGPCGEQTDDAMVPFGGVAVTRLWAPNSDTFCSVDEVPSLGPLHGVPDVGTVPRALTNTNVVGGGSTLQFPDDSGNDRPQPPTRLAFVWFGDGCSEDWSDLLGPDAQLEEIIGMTDSGWVVARYFNEEFSPRAAAYHPDFGATELFPEELESYDFAGITVTDVNEHGIVVGHYFAASTGGPFAGPAGFSSEEGGFRWSADSGFELESGWRYFGINSDGSIIGRAIPEWLEDPSNVSGFGGPASQHSVKIDGNWHDLEEHARFAPDVFLSELITISDDGRILMSAHSSSSTPGSLALVLVPVTPGDLNGDGAVDVFDLLLLLEQWGTCPVDAACTADLNGDGAVDVFDLLILLSNWST